MQLIWKGSLVVVLVLSAQLLGPARVIADTGFSLFTQEEAEQLRLEGEPPDQPVLLRTLPQGPLISVTLPQVTKSSNGLSIQTGTPAKLTVLFEQNRAPVDMDSLEVVAKKGIFSKSLTERLKPYIDGTSLKVDKVEIPAGRFMIEISIADQKGRETAQSYQLLVQM